MSTGRISLPDDDGLGAADRAFLATVPPVNVWRMLARYVDSTGVPIEEGPNPYAGIDSRGPVAAVADEQR